MLLLIASDLHGSVLAARALQRAADREKAEKILLLGDLLAFGAKKGDAAASILNEMAPMILAVRGNCDADESQDLLDFLILAETREFTWEGVPVFAAHGHRYSSLYLPPFFEKGVFLQGHTHLPAGEWNGSVFCANPGSLALPRGGAPKSYLTFDGSEFRWKDTAGSTFLQRKYNEETTR